MKSKTVELPPILRAPDGHAIYAPGSTSICSLHQFCAYTGDEEDRCPECHSLLDEDDMCSCDDLPPGRKSPCFCRKCKELFTSITAFDKHLVDGRHRDPARRGLVLVNQNGWSIWANPGTPPSRED